MYAAAGGASLASRQARQKQRQNKKAQLKNQKAGDLSAKAHKQFHNYTTDPGVVKLSRVERGALRPPPGGGERRHSTFNYLKEPSRARIRESPSISIPVQNHQPSQPLSPSTLVQNHVPLHSSLSVQSQLPQIFIPEGEGKLERRCSFVRQVEQMEKSQEGDILDRCNHMCNFEIKDNTWDNSHTYYTEYDKFGSLEYPFSECSQGRAAWQERERGRRCSLSEEARQHRIKQTEAHHRWMKRNRIHDAAFGSSGDEDDFLSVYHQSAAANALLYVGLGTTAIGGVIFFVGTGEKGFKTLELRMIGPTLIVCGILCCIIRVLLCACPSTCLRRKKKTRLKDGCIHNSARYPLAPKVSVDKANLLNKQKKKVCIAPTKHPIPSTSTMDFQESTTVYMEEKEKKPKETLEQDNKPVRPSNIPVIELPEFADFNSEPARLAHQDSIIELQALELCYDVQSVSGSDSDDEETTKTESKLTKVREPTNSMPEKSETTLSVVIEKDGGAEKPSEAGERQTHSGIVLSPLQLGQ